MTHTKLRFALFENDNPKPEVKEHIGDYVHQFDTVFDKAADNEHLSITWDIFDVKDDEEYPSFKDIESRKYDAFLLTGSGCSAAEDQPWILKLVDFLKKVQTDYADKVKLNGICFGHQIILRAAGGKSEKNDAGWEANIILIGWMKIQLNEDGHKFFKTDKKALRINQFHENHVSILPKDFKTLAFTEVNAPNHISISENGQCISIQGHPEYNRDTMRKMIKIRMDKGALEKDLAENCLDILENAPPEMEDVWFAERVLDFVLNKLQ